MSIRHACLTLTLPVALAAGCRPASRGALPIARANDNRTPAGRLANNRLDLRLTVGPTRWFPEADSAPSVVVVGFGEAGKPPELPGPLVRVRVGTTVRAAVRNHLADTIAVIGLGGPDRHGADTLRIAPGGVDSIEAVARTPGAYGYHGARIISGKLVGLPGDQLFGAFVVDSAGAPPDRILVIDAWTAGPVVEGDTALMLTFNGKSWPNTERLSLAVGDTLRLTVLNATGAEHPMHLHGFYYRVDARGTWHADTSYRPEDRRSVVTETLRAHETMSLTWGPSRPGNWLFHCHVASHVAGAQHDAIRGRAPSNRPVGSEHDHLQRGMAGLVLGLTVSGSPKPAILATDSATHRIEVVSIDQTYGDGTRILGYAVDGGPARAPAEPLVLVRGVQSRVTVLNRTSLATAVHWHGLELESYYDGVAGWSGAGTRTAPMIAPGDSFVAVMTPPRSGTFIFHSHIDDANQLAAGLVGPLLIVDPLTPRHPTRDQIWLFSTAGVSDSAPVVVNGDRPMPALAAGPQRIRVINITANDELDFAVLEGGHPIRWRPVAKDGADLPASQTGEQLADRHLGPGEVADFIWTAKPGKYRLAVKSYNNFERDFAVR